MKKSNKVKTKTKSKVSIVGGTLIGAVVGAAAGLLVGSQFGKKLGKGVLKKISSMSQTEYKAFITRAAQRYSKDKKLSVDQTKHLIKEAQAAWAHLKKNL